MNANKINGGTLDNNGFDRKLRQLHAEALVQVSAATAAQLQQRRRRALLGESAGNRPRMVRPLAWTGAMAALAIAIAIPVAMQWPQAPGTPAPSAAPTPPVVAEAGTDVTGIATLDEDPDLYLWMASNDAIALASE